MGRETGSGVRQQWWEASADGSHPDLPLQAMVSEEEKRICMAMLADATEWCKGANQDVEGEPKFRVILASSLGFLSHVQCSALMFHETGQDLPGPGGRAFEFRDPTHRAILRSGLAVMATRPQMTELEALELFKNQPLPPPGCPAHVFGEGERPSNPTGEGSCLTKEGDRQHSTLSENSSGATSEASSHSEGRHAEQEEYRRLEMEGICDWRAREKFEEYKGAWQERSDARSAETELRRTTRRKEALDRKRGFR